MTNFLQLTPNQQNAVSPTLTQIFNQATVSTTPAPTLQNNQTAFLNSPSISLPVFSAMTNSAKKVKTVTPLTQVVSLLPQAAQAINDTQKPPRLADFPKIAAQTQQVYHSSLFDSENVKNGGSVVISPQIVLQFQGGTTQETITEIQEFAEGKLRKIVQDELQEACNRTFRGLY